MSHKNKLYLQDEPAVMELLEPRLLLSAGAAGLFVAVDVPHVADAGVDAQMDVLTPEPPVDAPATVTHELVIIDPRTPDYQDLIESMQAAQDRHVEILVLDNQHDGIRQISEALATHHHLDAVHILSHGADGRLLLGDGWLDNNTLQASREAVAAWSASLNPGADLLFYGCDLAAGSEGQALLKTLQALTGADIAASDDATGHATLGGDWTLEYQAGHIDTSVLVDNHTQQHWLATLMGAPTVVNNTGSTLIEGGTDTITSSELTYSSSFGFGGINYSVTSGPTYGQLELTTNPGVAITDFTQSDIDANRLVYLHDGSSSSTTDSFVFDVTSGMMMGGNTNYNEVFNFTITPVNDAPVVNNQGFAVDENSANGAVVGTVLASDEDPGDTLTYSITAGNTGNAFSINASNGEITVNDSTQLDFESNPSFNLSVQVQDDGTGLLTDTAAVTINLNDLNEAPVVNNQIFAVDENSVNSTLVGTVAATDPDIADTLSYSITTGNTGNAFSINATTGEITVNDSTQLNFESNPTFNLTVQVQDNGVGTLTDTATITVNLNDLNEAPVVNNQSFAVDENSVNGTVVGAVAASDPDVADTLSYSLVAGNTGNVFSINAATGEITVNDSTQLDFETSPTFNLTVQVQDDGTGLLTDTATVTVNLNDLNEAPVANDQTLSVVAGSLNGAVVGTVAAQDPDNDSLVYSIVANDGHAPADFVINSATGEITINDNSNLGPAGGSHTLTVQVNDGTLTDTAVVTVNVTAGANAPTIDLVTNILDPVPEDAANGTLVADVDASDLDFDTITYSITGGNTGNAFAIDSATGEITVNNSSALDFETSPTYNLTVQASDGALNDSTVVTINLGDVNEAPVVNDQTFAVDENSTNGAVVGTVAASDQDTADTLTYSIMAGNTGNAFSINTTTGEISVNDSTQLDFESNPTFNLTIQVQDDGTGLLTDTATATINLNDLNDAPVVNNQTFAVDENSTNGTVAGIVAASDQDTADTLTYSITAGNTGNAFSINATTGEITVNDSTQLDFESNPTYNLTVQVQDNGTGTLTDTATVTINLNDINDAPVVNNQTFAVDENSANGTPVGTVAATDPDIADTLSYSITAGNIGNAFSINVSTGEITVNDSTQLDFETSPTFNLTVQVQDNGAGTLTDTATVIVNLNDLDETPPLLSANGGLTLLEGATATIDTTLLEFTDTQPAASVTYTLTGGLMNGQLQLSTNPGVAVTTFAQADIDAGRLVYVHDGSDTLSDHFDFTVDDGQGNRLIQQTFAISITPVDDTPPVMINNTGAGIVIGGSFVVTSDMLLAGDTQPAGSLTYTLTSLPADGRLELNGVALGPGDTFTQADVNAANLVYTQTGDGSDGFSFDIDDGQGNQLTGLGFAVNALPPDVVAPVIIIDAGLPPPPVTPLPGVVNPAPAADLPPLDLEPVISGGGSHGGTAEPPSEDSAAAPPGETARAIVDKPTAVPPVQLPQAPPVASAVDKVDGVPVGTTAPHEPAQGQRLSDTLWLALNRSQAAMEESAAPAPWILAATRGVVWSFSAGFLAWILRGGSLLAMTLSSMPMWRWMDPLPILPLSRRERDKRKAESQAEAAREIKEQGAMAAVLDERSCNTPRRPGKGDSIL